MMYVMYMKCEMEKLKFSPTCMHAPHGNNKLMLMRIPGYTVKYIFLRSRLNGELTSHVVTCAGRFGPRWVHSLRGDARPYCTSKVFCVAGSRLVVAARLFL